jgi:hypothetical protein
MTVGPGAPCLLLGVCPSHPSLRDEGGAAEARLQARKNRTYSLPYVEVFFEPRTTQGPADRLPQENGLLGQTPRSRRLLIRDRTGSLPVEDEEKMNDR